jgi:hypothetical protein
VCKGLSAPKLTLNDQELIILVNISELAGIKMVSSPGARPVRKDDCQNGQPGKDCRQFLIHHAIALSPDKMLFVAEAINWREQSFQIQ